MSKEKKALNESENEDQLLLDEEVSKRLVLEHPSYKELEDKLTKEEQKSQENWDALLRSKADLENVQRRTEREVANAHKYGLERFVSEILVVVDNLERSLQTKTSDQKELKDFYDGIELTLKLFLETLEKFDVKPIHPLSEEFDPEKHTAVMTKEDADAKSNVILEVVQKGYWLKDRLLRPALVVVAK